MFQISLCCRLHRTFQRSIFSRRWGGTASGTKTFSKTFMSFLFIDNVIAFLIIWANPGFLNSFHIPITKIVSISTIWKLKTYILWVSNTGPLNGRHWLIHRFRFNYNLKLFSIYMAFLPKFNAIVTRFGVISNYFAIFQDLLSI